MMFGSLAVPVPAQAASKLADMLFQFAEGRTVDDALRRMLAARSSQAEFDGIRVFWGSLAADPVAKSTYYLAVEGKSPVLLHIAPAPAPGSGFFPHSTMVGVMRTMRGVEVAVNAIPFGLNDTDRIQTFVSRLDRGLAPCPQGVQTLFVAARQDADLAFSQFRAVQKKYGLPVAAWAGPSGEGLWGAVRYGWRDGYSMRGDAAESSRTLVDGAGCEDRALGEQIDAVRRFRGRTHDIDVRFDRPGQLTQPDALRARMEELRQSGRQVQGVEVDLGLRPEARYPRELAEMEGWPAEVVSRAQWQAGGRPREELRLRVEALQQAIRPFGAILCVTGYGSTDAETLEAIGTGAGRRLWFSLGEGLDSGRILELVGALRG